MRKFAMILLAFIGCQGVASMVHYYYQSSQLSVVNGQAGLTSILLVGDQRIAKLGVQSSGYYLGDGKSSDMYLNYSHRGNYQKTIDYQAYGKSAMLQKGADLDQFGYDNEAQDSATQLIYLKARDYSPVSQHFMTMDSEPLLNRYHFADQNPVGNIDPTGHNAVPQLLNLAIVVGVTIFGNAYDQPFAGNLVGSLAGQAVENGLAHSQGQSVNWVADMLGALASPVAMGLIAESTSRLNMKLFQSHVKSWLAMRMLSGILTIDGGALVGEAVQNVVAHQKFQPNLTLLAVGAATGIFSGLVDYSMVYRTSQIDCAQSILSKDSRVLSSEGNQRLKAAIMRQNKGIIDEIFDPKEVLRPIGWQSRWLNRRGLRPFYLMYKYGIHNTLEYVGDDIFAIFERNQ